MSRRNRSLILSCVVALLFVVGCSGGSLDDAVKARTDVALLMKEVEALPQDMRTAMRKVIDKAETTVLAAEAFFEKDKYAEAAKKYKEAEALLREAVAGREVLERLAEARKKLGRARTLAKMMVPKEEFSEAKRLETNAEGYCEAAEFQKAITALDKARAEYDRHVDPAVKTATVDDAVASRTALQAARKQLRDLPPSQPTEFIRQRAIQTEAIASEAMENREYGAARTLFDRATRLYLVVSAHQRARDAMRSADGAFKTETRTASFERGKQALADGTKALEEGNVESAGQSFAIAMQFFAQARNEAPLANDLAEVRDAWTAAAATADEDLLGRHAAADWAAAKKIVASAEAAAAAGKMADATRLYKDAAAALKGAYAKALTLEKTAKAAPVITRLEQAIARKDKFAAEDVLGDLEKLIPSDARMPALREKVTAMPGPKKTLTVDLGGGVKMELVLIRPGAFRMGSEDGEADEKPAHEVTISKPFYMGKYEVTQEQWKALMGTDPSHFKGARNPVEQVGWDDCQTLLRKLGEKVPAHKFRLPTEAEWEYACRAGSATKYCYGDDDTGLAEYAWYGNNSGGQTHPVGKKEPNAWGLYDMHGNVWEWCQDWYGGYAADEQTDPAGPASGQGRVLRGGGWGKDHPVYCRSACRFSDTPVNRYGFFGFRVVCAAGVD